MLCPECNEMWRDPKNRGACVCLCPKCKALPIPAEEMKLTSNGLDTPGLTKDLFKTPRGFEPDPKIAEAIDKAVKELTEKLYKIAEQLGVYPHELDFTTEMVQEGERYLARLRVWIKGDDEH